MGPMSNGSFAHLRATELVCPRCRTAQPVVERLLLILPHADLMDYRCRVCGTSCGSREVPRGRTAPPFGLQPPRGGGSTAQ